MSRRDVEKSNPYAAPLAPSLVETPTHVRWTFCGLQTYWKTPDRYYKVYITDQGLYAGWIGGQFYSKRSARMQLSPLYATIVGALIVEPVAMWIDNRRNRLEKLYDSLIVEPSHFLQADSRNVFVPRAEIRSVEISTRRSSWMFWTNSGILTFQLLNSPSPFTLLVDSTRMLAEIIAELAAGGYPVDLTTVPPSISIPASTTSSTKTD